MNFIGRKIYYDKITGNVLVDTGEMCGDVRETTVEEDFQVFTALSGRNPETVGVIKLAYGEMRDDFMMAESYRVDPATGKLIFTYRDPDNPTVPPVEKPSYEERIFALEQALLTIIGL
jgi:hypothetical protein